MAPTLYTTLFETATTILSGLAAGGMGYITIVEAPSRAKLPSGDLQLEHWRVTFPKAMSVFKTLNLAMGVLSAACGYVSGNQLYYASAAAFGLIAPFTVVTIVPLYKKLQTCDMPQSDKDKKSVEAIIAKWGRLHAVRVGLGVVGFALSVVAISGRVGGGEVKGMFEG